jgi:hypothetical protein
LVQARVFQPAVCVLLAASVYSAACQKDIQAFVPQGHQKQRKRVELTA